MSTLGATKHYWVCLWRQALLWAYERAYPKSSENKFDVFGDITSGQGKIGINGYSVWETMYLFLVIKPPLNICNLFFFKMDKKWPHLSNWQIDKSFCIASVIIHANSGCLKHPNCMKRFNLLRNYFSRTCLETFFLFMLFRERFSNII